MFQGLAIHEHWDWSVRHPVLRLSFGRGNFKEPDYLHTNLMAQLDAIGRQAGIGSDYATAPERFAHLIETLHEAAGQRVAVLVDEYDKPILDTLEAPEVARANRDYLRGLYGTIKDSDAHVKFTLLTGVSKFSKVNLFSGLNNLIDLTLEPGFSGGMRLHRYGPGHGVRAGAARPRPRHDPRLVQRLWLVGRGEGLQPLRHPAAVPPPAGSGAWWFETGTPAFLVETLVSRGVRSVDLDGMLGSEALLSAFDVDAIAPEALLFQTGYLTIRGAESRGGRIRYRLGYPNREGVRESLNESLLYHLVGKSPQREEYGTRLYDLLEANDFTGLETLFGAFFASIPHQWHTNNPIADYEGYYASVFYSYFTGAGLEAAVEDSTSRGRLDMAVRFNKQVYLFEFKVVELAGAGEAMAQLRERRYADKYRRLGQPIHLVAVEFSRESGAWRRSKRSGSDGPGRGRPPAHPLGSASV